jgi:hypothetical protein
MCLLGSEQQGAHGEEVKILLQGFTVGLNCDYLRIISTLAVPVYSSRETVLSLLLIILNILLYLAD